MQRARFSPPCTSVSPLVKAFLVLLLGILPGPVAAQVRNWRIADFKDTIAINRDASAFVSEKIALVFVGQWHGIHRTIPVEYPGPHGTNYTLFVDVKSVTDENGNKLKYESSKSGDFLDLKIYIPDAVRPRRVLLERDRQRLAGPH